VRQPLKGVGKNLQDHLVAHVRYTRTAPGPFVRHMRIDRLAAELAKGYCFGTGFATDLPGGAVGFIKTEPALPAPDIQVLFHAGPLSAGPYLPPFRGAFADGFSSIAVLLRPESRGRLQLASADPATPIRIHQNFLAAERDWKMLRAGLRRLIDIGKRKELAPFVGKELLKSGSDAELDAHVRATAITAHHPLGTCRMGLAREEGTVVDESLRVLGTESLRVVDASVMPDLVGGNINATVVMIAETASDLLRGRAPLAPAVLPG
jgi:choline dehydrogenase/4-pyridoxate dehydrogenase